MPVKVSYFFVVLIWSTTPLGIVWSSDSIPPTMSVFLRMLIALVLGAFVMAIANIRLPWHGRAIKLYTYSALGIYGGMMLSYFAAQSVPSGVISLVFGLAPILSGLLAQRILNEAKFSKIKVVALVMSVLGLALVCKDQLVGKSVFNVGLLYVLAAVCCFSLSGVMVKTVKLAIHPMATTFGALVIVTPLFFVTWLLVDGTFNPSLWSERAIGSIIYLGVFGSLLGFLAYFHVLQKLDASTVALITLITPGFAIALGTLLNNESLSVSLVVGAIIILVSLGLFQFGDKLLKTKKRSALGYE
ncbi:DMT family transporter [Pseudoalteromonas sp. G4]|uniref:DMT family transporter n=1 Tax=Pseudoalteromonas sp. G4 TaxID=2992761 RepID=UPI00237D56DE|nr:DMT family transporter [Pseudoalteromonas sp. G4]MDE3271811.1 DMT family transporter [Pseudoalteromonas sp. G4]